MPAHHGYIRHLVGTAGQATRYSATASAPQSSPGSPVTPCRPRSTPAVPSRPQPSPAVPSVAWRLSHPDLTGNKRADRTRCQKQSGPVLSRRELLMSLFLAGCKGGVPSSQGRPPPPPAVPPPAPKRSCTAPDKVVVQLSDDEEARPSPRHRAATPDRPVPRDPCHHRSSLVVPGRPWSSPAIPSGPERSPAPPSPP